MSDSEKHAEQTTGVARSASLSVVSPASDDAQRKAIGRIISVVIILGTVILALFVWSVTARHPSTDVAVARANVVGIVPQVRGQIVKLNVQESQAVKEGEVLFEIDAKDYEFALAGARADLATLDQQIEVATAQDAELGFSVVAEEAAVERSRAQLKQAEDTLSRVQPLLQKGFATAEQVDQARTSVQVAASALAAEEQRLNSAKAALSTRAALIAKRPAVEANIQQAELNVARCKVTAPFPGRVVSLNISAGAYANAGTPVFSLLDTRRWYVIAGFREGELRYIKPGTKVEVYLLSAPDRRFQGIVQGIGWAVAPQDESDLKSVPSVKRELNWVHISQRFPVRIDVTDPDPELFRMGASAAVIIKSGDSK